jgi:hypothetical protein
MELGMNWDNGGGDKWREALAWVVMALCVIGMCALVTGCKTTEYVEVPVTHTEYVYRDRVDSVAVHDSVYIKEWQKGDTIRVVEYRYKDRFRYIYATDTLIQRDTISVVSTQVVERVEYRTRGVVKILAWLGVAGLLALAAYLYLRFKGYFRR